MSRHEYNKGKLIPVDKSFKDIYEGICGVGAEPAYGTYEEYIRDDAEGFGYVVLKGKPYQIEWDCCSGELYEFNNTVILEDGSISFETYHYNGGAHWTELVEDKLSSTVNTKTCEDMLEALGKKGNIDQSFSGYLVAVLEVEDVEHISKEYRFKSIVEEATNISKERQKQLELEF